jgi:hypothetical protein
MYNVEDYLVNGNSMLVEDVNNDIRYFVEKANQDEGLGTSLIKKAEHLKESAESYLKVHK